MTALTCHDSPVAINEKLLNPGEKIIFSTRTHVKALVLPALIFVVVAGAAGYLLSLTKDRDHKNQYWIARNFFSFLSQNLSTCSAMMRSVLRASVNAPSCVPRFMGRKPDARCVFLSRAASRNSVDRGMPNLSRTVATTLCRL